MRTRNFAWALFVVAAVGGAAVGGAAGAGGADAAVGGVGTRGGAGGVGEVRGGRGLKDAYAGKFGVGTSGDVPRGFSPGELETIKTNFNMLMAENCMKPQAVCPTANTWNWTAADALVDYAQANGMQVIGHVLVWHAGNPAWLFSNTEGEAGKDVLIGRLKTHIETEVGRYAGKVAVWHVVNEAINDAAGAGAGAGGENLRNSPWLQKLGRDYISLAFKFARAADPKAKLYYNDYNIEKGAKHDSSMLLLKRLVAEGVPIDGVGIQGHWSANNVPLVELEKAIEDYAKLGLKVSISELDIAVGGGGPASRPEALKSQTEAYQKVMEVLLAHREAIDHVVFYGLNDKRSWRSAQVPTLFDGEGKAKGAWEAVMGEGGGGNW